MCCEGLCLMLVSSHTNWLTPAAGYLTSNRHRSHNPWTSLTSFELQRILLYDQFVTVSLAFNRSALVSEHSLAAYVTDAHASVVAQYLLPPCPADDAGRNFATQRQISCEKRSTKFIVTYPASYQNKLAEIITLRFAGWISGRIVSLQPDRISKNCFQTGTGYGQGYPKHFFVILRIQTLGKSCTLHNHLFSIFGSICSAFCAMTQRWDRIRIIGVDSGGILRFFRTGIRAWSQKLGKKRTRIRNHFLISAVAGVCVVIS